MAGQTSLLAAGGIVIASDPSGFSLGGRVRMLLNLFSLEEKS
jgi:hypothetical protein